MKSNSYSHKSRGRSSPRRNGSSFRGGQSMDSSGPGGKVRGSINQIYEKYLALARDATSSGDRISAEGFYQHAEHYYRLINAQSQSHPPNGNSGSLRPRRKGGERKPPASEDREDSPTRSEDIPPEDSSLKSGLKS